MIPEKEIKNVIQDYLNPDEKTIWSGTPKHGLVFRRSDLIAIPVSVLWFVFSILWLINIIKMEAPTFFWIFGIILVSIGFYFVFGRFWTDVRKRANTSYEITNNRIIIKSGVFLIQTKSLNIKNLSDITVNEREDGSGTITLGPTQPFYGMYKVMNWPGMKYAPSIELVPNVRKIYNLIVKLQSE